MSMTPQEMRDYIKAAPLPGEASPSDYNTAGSALAHCFLVLCEDDPTLLDVPSREDDPTGFQAADNDKLWQAFKTRWPDGDDWLGGATGFMFGWAHNTVRYVLDRPLVGNPAVLTVGSSEDQS